MTTISHEPHAQRSEVRPWLAALWIREMWAGLAIIAIWLAVLFSAVYGADIVDTGGTNNFGGSTTVPSGVVVAVFAFFATWPVAKYGFGRKSDKS